MSTPQENDGTGLVLSLVIALILFLLAVIIGLGLYQTHARKASDAPVAAQTGAPGAPGAPGMEGMSAITGESIHVKVENGLVLFHFEPGQTEVVTGSAQALVEVVLAVQSGKKAIISGYVDNTGSVDANMQIARQRALAVRDLLKAAGLSDEQIELIKPTQIEAGTGAQARRVEVRLR